MTTEQRPARYCLREYGDTPALNGFECEDVLWGSTQCSPECWCLGAHALPLVKSASNRAAMASV